MSRLPERSHDPLPDIDTAELYDLITALFTLRRDLAALCGWRSQYGPGVDPDHLREDMHRLGCWLVDTAGGVVEIPFFAIQKETAHARD